VDVRVVAATNKNLEEEIARGIFREDLYHRINVLPLIVPPLRERREDIPLLAAHFINELSQENAAPAKTFTPAALAALATLPWPGNVRELENRVNAAAIMVEGKTVTAEDLSLDPPTEETGVPLSLREARRHAENAAVQRALAVTGGNISKAAELLGVTRPTLYEILERTTPTLAK
jgi:two-component system NtrC family response regulator